MDSWTIFKPRASSLRRQVSYDSVTENQCDGNCDLKKVVKVSKVEKILKGSLDSIPSPSVKIQIMGGKVCLRCKGKTLLGDVNKVCCF